VSSNADHDSSTEQANEGLFARCSYDFSSPENWLNMNAMVTANGAAARRGIALFSPYRVSAAAANASPTASLFQRAHVVSSGQHPHWRWADHGLMLLATEPSCSHNHQGWAGDGRYGKGNASGASVRR
jgi:hypothetical protein